MSFLEAVRSLGVLEKNGPNEVDGGIDDIVDFLSMPLAEGQAGGVIRVWLQVSDPRADTLDVQGVKDIDLVEYLAGESSLETNRMRYLYRDPPGTNTPWMFTPLLKLGKGTSEGVKELRGEGDWRENRKSRFNGLYRRVLNDYEQNDLFTPGSVDRIMEDLNSQAERIAGLWTDKKLSYLLLLGVEDNGKFLYPGEVPLFVQYFRQKFFQGKKAGIPVCCATCRAEDTEGIHLSRVFKFATFDKESFLPGIKNSSGVQEKVFPLCPDCYSLVSKGRETMNRLFLDRRIIPGINIFILPELLLGERFLPRISQVSQDFLKNGIGNEIEIRFNALARQDEALVFHFVFWEQNQAQERLHLMIEDVPPSRLNHLRQLWRETVACFSEEEVPEEGNKGDTLDRALWTIRQVLFSLAGKREQDKKYMRERVIGLVGKLLAGERIPIYPIKALCVSRFAGLFSDEEWLRNGRSGGKRMEQVIDFLARVDRSASQ